MRTWIFAGDLLTMYLSVLIVKKILKSRTKATGSITAAITRIALREVVLQIHKVEINKAG